ncbi:MAG: helix-turn-helix domain-containing protein [Specibacter sp.]
MSSVVKKIAEIPVTTRIPAAERRELILQAATTVFAERGYAGATTDQVAKAAAISQPYVVRMFGTKEALFLEAFDRALGTVLREFRAVIADYDAGLLADKVASLDPAQGTRRQDHLKYLIAVSYADLIADRGILMMLMQSFVAGHEPVIGPRARDGFLTMFRLIRDEAGMDADSARDFLAQGMLMNTLISLRLPEVYDEDATAGELLECTLKAKLNMVLDTSRAQQRIG